MNKIILFDVDGTLVDSKDAIYTSFSNVFRDNSLPPPPKHKVSSFIGYPLNEMFKIFGVDSNDIDRFCAEYKNYYLRISNQLIKILPNAIASLNLAKSFAILGIVTTKSSRSTRELLSNFGVLDLFSVIIGREDVSSPKPNPEPILKALDSIKDSKYKEAFMVGDTILDLQAALKSNVNGIGVLCGYGSLALLEKYSKWIFNDTLEAVEFIKNRN